MPNKRLPDSVHLLRGTYKKHRHGDPKNKSKVDIECPDPPDFIVNDDAAIAEWNRVTEIMLSYAVLSVLDRSVLSQFCVLWSKMTRSPDDFSASEHTQLRLCAAELGITAVKRDSAFTSRRLDNESSKFKKF